MTDQEPEPFVTRMPSATAFGERLMADTEGAKLILELAKASNETPLKSFRIPQALYEKAQRRAADRNETLSHAIRKFLERYTR